MNSTGTQTERFRISPTVWGALGLLLCVDAIWMHVDGWTIVPATLHMASLRVAVWLAIPFVLARWLKSDEAKSLFLNIGYGSAMGPAFGLLMYLAVARKFPLIDHDLASADTWLGLDWCIYDAWLQRHAVILKVLEFAYYSIPLQMLLLIAFLSLTARFGRIEECWNKWNVAVCVTIVTGMLFPAEGPGKYFHPLNAALYTKNYSHFESLRAGTMTLIDLGAFQGLVSMPSFHTVAAVLFVWSTRRTRLFYIALPLNSLMVLATPVWGGHYFVDVIAGAVLAVLLIQIQRYRVPGFTAQVPRAWQIAGRVTGRATLP